MLLSPSTRLQLEEECIALFRTSVMLKWSMPTERQIHENKGTKITLVVVCKGT